MKKNIFIAAIFTMVFLFSACNASPGNAENVQISIGNSVKFTEEEIQQAVEVVKKKFKELEHCDLLTLEYNEEKSNAKINDYLRGGHGAYNGARAENIIVFNSTFYAGPQVDFMTPDTTYPWRFILVQKVKERRWIVDD